MIKTAVVLAGGKGVRLRPLTLTTPKPLLPVGNKAIIEHILSLLISYGFERIIVAVNYLGHKIASHFLEKYLDAGVEILIPEITPHDTADAVRKLSRFIDEDFIVTMGDVITNMNLRDFADFHERSKAIASVAVIEVGSVRDFGAVILDEKGRILHFMEKPGTSEWYVATVAYSTLSHRHFRPYVNLANSGFYGFKREILDILSDTPYLMDFGRHVFPWLLENNYTVMGWNAGEAYWMDVGRPSTYLVANMDLLDGAASPLVPYGKNVNNVWVGEDTVISKSAVINPPVALGDYTVIDEGAVIGPYAIIGSRVKIGKKVSVVNTIVMDDCVLEDQTILMNSILAKKILVKRGSSVTESVIGDNSVIESGLSVGPTTHINPGSRVAKQEVS
ncbi:MAG: sugar phosphate nucleotidyltransferase [Infirmifilum sp.]